MEEFKVYALDDEGNRVEPASEQQTEQQPAPQEAQPVEAEPQNVEQDAVQQEQGQIENEGSLQEQAEEQVDVQEEKVLEPEPEQDDNWFLSKLKERYEVEVNSVDDLKNVLSNNEKQTLPEDVEKYLEFRNETGRSFSDFAELQKDWTAVSDEQVIREYYKQTKPHLDQEDIEHILGEQFSFDTELDDEKEVRAKKIAYKEALYEARNHFEGLKERYKAPLESSAADIPENYKEAFSFYSEYQAQASQQQKIQEEQASYFTQQTNALFNDEFKGFEFNVGDKKQSIKPTDIAKTKELQGSLDNFVSQHLDETGKLKNAESYHKSIYAAMNPDALAKHFYELGKADATGDIVKETKNIDMSVRDNKETVVQGTKFKVLDSGDNFEFKIRKRN